MWTLLAQAVDAGLFRPLDVQLARLLAGDDDPRLALLVAKLSAEAGDGHVCLPLASMNKASLFSGRHDDLADALWSKAGNPTVEDFLRSLSHSPAVGDGEQATPLVLDGDRLYLQRMWRDEGKVAGFLLCRGAYDGCADVKTLRQTLDGLFPNASQEVNWQKVAAAVAATRSVSVISGGPGTGKTTTVARLLAALLMLDDAHSLRIALAAPTGKAAARLTESLGAASRTLPLTDAQRGRIPSEASTLHRLLGIQLSGTRLRYHAQNPLHFDVIIVDEASMVDLPMMARLVDALPSHARLILLGDRDQLASVEAGAVLGDVCRFAELGYSVRRAAQLSELTGYAIAPGDSPLATTVRDGLCLLRKSYRFDQDSGIGRLALAVNQGDGRSALACFKQDHGDLEWCSSCDVEDYQRLLEVCIEGYRDYLEAIAKPEKEASDILARFNRFRLLCALRSGPFGVEGLNERIELMLQRRKLINRPAGAAGLWYSGRPVMVNRNDASLGLYNGDIGIAFHNEEGELRVHFQLPDGSIKSVPPSRLPSSETAFVMTVHKSQGSEFDHTVLALPEQYTPLLSRELVYTAITRARKRLTLFAAQPVLMSAIATPTERRSGLAERLVKGDTGTSAA